MAKKKPDLVSQTRAMTKGTKAPKKRPDETPPVSQSKEGEDLHERAMRHASEAWSAEFDNIDKGRDDQRFYAGEQWAQDTAMTRRDENRPVITINRLPGFVRQLTGDVRQNTPAIKVLPARGEASKEIAKIFNGLIRNIEVESNAKQAYVKGIENAAICGQGGWRLTTEYSSDDAFEQDIRIKRIVDPFAVLMDPMARQPDKSDARYCFVFEDITKEDFAKRYPDHATDSMPTGIAGKMAVSWTTSDTVKLAEYWYRETRKRTLQLMSDGTVRYADEAEEPAVDMPPELAQLEPTVVQEREVDAVEIKSIWMNGKEVLGGPYLWAGRYIPIVMVTGEEIYFDGLCVRRGMVRDAKDPQRIYNYTRTASVEAVAMQPKSPFVGTKKQFDGFEDDWATAGSKNHSHLTYNPDPAAPGPPQRVQPAITSTGLDIQSQLANDDMKGVTGIYDASLGQKSNETSGRAILARQKEGDTGTFHFIDNLAVGIEYTGRILVDLIPKIYDATRIVRTLEEDGGEEMVPINVPHPDRAVDQRGQEIVLNDLSLGEYDVVVITGPSFATKRQEAAESMTEMMRSFPQIMPIAGDLILKNMDIPQAEEIGKRMERTIPQNLREDGPPQPPPPDPVMIAEVRETMASANLKDAQAAKTLLEADAVAAQLGSMGAQLQQLTQLVMGLGKGGPPPQGGPPGEPSMGGPMMMPPPGAEPPGGPPMPMDTPPDGMPPMAELEPIEGAPV